MHDMGAMPAMQPWGIAQLGAAIAMWAVMMVVMMTPSAAPLVLVYRRMHRGSARATAAAPVALVAGYLLVWTAFSVLAALMQGGLHAAGLLQGERVGTLLGGALFLVAGAWQLTPLKRACLRHCRGPMDFLVTEWRDGVQGAMLMGMRHGAWCVGCCWALMLLLFAAGVMNVWWIALLAGWVLLEKTMPARLRLHVAGGVAAVAFGCWRIATAIAG